MFAFNNKIEKFIFCDNYLAFWWSDYMWNCLLIWPDHGKGYGSIFSSRAILIYSCSESGPTCRFLTSTIWIHTVLCHQESPDKQSTHLNIFHLRHFTAVIHLLLGHPLSLLFKCIPSIFFFPSFLWLHLHLDSLHSTPKQNSSSSLFLFIKKNIFSSMPLKPHCHKASY